MLGAAYAYATAWGLFFTVLWFNKDFGEATEGAGLFRTGMVAVVVAAFGCLPLAVGLWALARLFRCP